MPFLPSLGASHVGVFLRSTQRPDVMYDRVVLLGRRYHTPAATVLGWTLAREVGHFLVGDAHAPVGVIAARLTPTGFLDEPFAAEKRAFIQTNAATWSMQSPGSAGCPAALVIGSPVDRTH